jgi:hypothetical protein
MSLYGKAHASIASFGVSAVVAVRFAPRGL